jgi:hypothetical protein
LYDRIERAKESQCRPLWRKGFALHKLLGLHSFGNRHTDRRVSRLDSGIEAP